MSIELGTLIIGLTAVFQKIGIANKWLPLVAVILGIILAGAPYIYSPYAELLHACVEGAMTALVATGLVSTVDKRLEKLNIVKNEQSTSAVTQ